MIVVLVQLAATWFMAGSITTMQVLNYPLLSRVGADRFADYERAHNRRFALVVVPGVVVVAVTTAVLLVAPPDPLGRLLPSLGALLLVAIVAMTARWQAPAHARLARGFDPVAHRTLVRSNAVRTVAWALFGVLDAVMLTLVVG